MDYPEAEIVRVRSEYADRETRLRESNRYRFDNPGYLFEMQRRTWRVVRLLRDLGRFPLASQTILELGCGNGGVLLEYLSYGANPRKLFGADLLANRVSAAHDRLPHLPLACADGRRLPYPSASFDLVIQYTMFTSILDDTIRKAVASEMVRVLKPGGLVLWYDFWINPSNPETHGIGAAEIRGLFPGCSVTLRKVTLAPPISRRVTHVSVLLATMLENLGLFNSHYLAAIRPQSGPKSA